jgi:dihydroflavonol-4-reductase
MRILLTGATGFVGSHVARALVAAGHTVRALARATSPRSLLDDVPELEWVRGDLLDPPTLAAAADRCEVVVHTAARVVLTPTQAREQHAVNVEGTRHMLAAARAAGARRFIHTSSVATVGRPRAGELADENTRYDWPPGLPYNETKRDAERLVLRADGLETVVLNPALVFGPGALYKRTLTLFRLVKWGLLPVVPPGGLTICDVRDIAAAHVAALTQGEARTRYILGGPHVTFRELATTIAEVTRGARPIAAVPPAWLHAVAVPLAALIRVGVPLPVTLGSLAYMTNFGYYSSARAQSALGYRMRAATETLADAARWYESQHLL